MSQTSKITKKLSSILQKKVNKSGKTQTEVKKVSNIAQKIKSNLVTGIKGKPQGKPIPNEAKSYRNNRLKTETIKTEKINKWKQLFYLTMNAVVIYHIINLWNTLQRNDKVRSQFLELLQNNYKFPDKSFFINFNDKYDEIENCYVSFVKHINSSIETFNPCIDETYLKELIENLKKIDMNVGKGKIIIKFNKEMEESVTLLQNLFKREDNVFELLQKQKNLFSPS